MNGGVYLFCLTSSAPPPVVDGRGVDGRNRIFSHVVMDVAAVVSMVSLDEFCGPSAEANLQDLSWLAPRACRHAEVVDQVMERAPVLPVPFGTIFSSLENMEERLIEHMDIIGGFLDRAADRQEWSVKGFVDRAKAADALLSANLARQEERLGSLPPGQRYFQEKKLRAETQKQLNSSLKEICAGVVEELNSMADGFFQRPARAEESDGIRQILNWAFWVPGDRLTDFQDTLKAINSEQGRCGLTFELSGPWPPYSFHPRLENR